MMPKATKAIGGEGLGVLRWASGGAGGVGEVEGALRRPAGEQPEDEPRMKAVSGAGRVHDRHTMAGRGNDAAPGAGPRALRAERHDDMPGAPTHQPMHAGFDVI